MKWSFSLVAQPSYQQEFDFAPGIVKIQPKDKIATSTQEQKPITVGPSVTLSVNKKES
jgi:hypothetical protein